MNTSSLPTPPERNEESEVDKELQAALEMPDSEYIEHLEAHIEALSEANTYGLKTIETFVELLDFIGENFGTTADFPIRIDNDFYEGVFSEQISACQNNLEKFFEAYGNSNVIEDVELNDEEVF
jgi:hypothetical protein